MRRREFFALLGGTTAIWPVAARAQQQPMPVVGYLGSGSTESDIFRVQAFRQGLSDAGFIDGQNVTVDYRWAHDDHARLPALAAELVNRRVAVLVAFGVSAALAAKAATTTIPVVFETAADPVQLGFVASLARPGGNVTGVTQLGEEALPKRVELLHELLPAARVMALLVNPADPALAEPQVRVSLEAAKTLGLELPVVHASGVRDFDGVFAKLKDLRASALIIAGSVLFTGHNDELAALTVQHGIPAIYQRREFAAAGGLMGYGSNIADSIRLTGIYAGRILKGEKPADLPVQQATKVELYINLKTARALGVTVPSSLIARADEVIE